MKLEIKDNCPLNNFKKCKQLECAWFVQMKGTNPSLLNKKVKRLSHNE